MIEPRTSPLVREDDLEQHIEDDMKVNTIRDGKLVEVAWNELTEAERRAAYVGLFDIYGE